MTPKRAFFLFLSTLAGLFLILLLVGLGHVNVRATLSQLLSVRPTAFLKLVLLNLVLVAVSTQKWRSIDATLRHSSHSAPSALASFSVTSVGLAAGLFVPVQLAMTGARTVATHFHGGAFKRGTVGTLYEQMFDLLTAGALAIASVLTVLSHGGVMFWMFLAALATSIQLLLVKPAIGIVQWLASLGASAGKSQSRARAFLNRFADIQVSGLLQPQLARRLVILSTLRFSIVVLMSVQTAECIGLHISAWRMAAAIPFVVLTSVVALTPGGLGIYEVSAATALTWFGVPLAVGAQWAIGNRVLIAISYLVVAVIGALGLIGAKAVGKSSVVAPPASPAKAEELASVEQL